MEGRGGRDDKGVLGSLCNNTFRGITLEEKAEEAENAGERTVSSALRGSSLEGVTFLREEVGECVNLEKDESNDGCLSEDPTGWFQGL